MKCPTCIAEGKTSTVTRGARRSTLMASVEFWDENGMHHPRHNPNTVTTDYRCSNGHSWSEKDKEMTTRLAEELAEKIMVAMLDLHDDEGGKLPIYVLPAVALGTASTQQPSAAGITRTSPATATTSTSRCGQRSRWR